MSHVSELRWGQVRDSVAQLTTDVLSALARTREMSVIMFILGVRTGGTDEGLAGQLFKDEIALRQMEADANTPEGETPPVIGPSAAEIQMVADLKDVATALFQLWQAANNEAVTTADRANTMRRITHLR